MTEGRLSTSSRPWVFKARTRRLKESLAAEKTKPPTPLVGDTRPRPKFPKPCNPTTPGLTTGLLPCCPVLKGKPGFAVGLSTPLTDEPAPRMLGAVDDGAA